MKRDYDGWRNKKTVCNAIQKQVRNAETCYHMDARWKYQAKWKTPVTKDHMWHDFIYVKCPEQVSWSRATEKQVTAEGLVGENVGVTTPGCADKNALKLCRWVHNFVNVYKTLHCVLQMVSYRVYELNVKKVLILKRDCLWTLNLPGRRCPDQAEKTYLAAR